MRQGAIKVVCKVGLDVLIRSEGVSVFKTLN